MAGSSRQGCALLPEEFLVPGKTPGTLGINDQADPNVTTALGDTPGSIGISDWADPSRFFASTPPFYLGVTSENSVCQPLALGLDLLSRSPVTPAPAVAAIALPEAQEIALRISTYFEGGKSLNYQALAGDFDGQGTSFGLIQWNFGSGTLGPLLKKMMDKDAAAFKACFNENADYETIGKAIAGGNTADELSWARKLTRVKHSKEWEAWHSAFTKIGSNDAFNKIQFDQAIAQYHPLAVAVIAEIRKISPSLFADVEVRSYCAIYDLCVQQHGIAKVIHAIAKRVQHEKPANQLELMKIVVVERGLKAKSKWVSDCISRRMGILLGAPYKSTEHNVTQQRNNPQFSLLAGSGSKYVASL
jgi:hypothetical protein